MIAQPIRIEDTLRGRFLFTRRPATCMYELSFDSSLDPPLVVRNTWWTMQKADQTHSLQRKATEHSQKHDTENTRSARVIKLKTQSMAQPQMQSSADFKRSSSNSDALLQSHNITGSSLAAGRPPYTCDLMEVLNVVDEWRRVIHEASSIVWCNAYYQMHFVSGWSYNSYRVEPTTKRSAYMMGLPGVQRTPSPSSNPWPVLPQFRLRKQDRCGRWRVRNRPWYSKSAKEERRNAAQCLSIKALDMCTHPSSVRS